MGAPWCRSMGGWYGGLMAISECCFETDRLVVGDWSRLLTGQGRIVVRCTPE